MAKYPFYDTSKWRKLRQFVIDRAGGICEICHVEKGTIADHIKEVNDDNVNDPDIVWNPDNLQALCQGCHNKKTHGSGEAVMEGYRFDDMGILIYIGIGEKE
jgi:5-methylcytosine-specific restriction endonuclease McrA